MQLYDCTALLVEPEQGPDQWHCRFAGLGMQQVHRERGCECDSRSSALKQVGPFQDGLKRALPGGPGDMGTEGHVHVCRAVGHVASEVWCRCGQVVDSLSLCSCGACGETLKIFFCSVKN